MERSCKVCPILTIAGGVCQEGKKYCEKEYCAWWDNANQGCGITNISYFLLEILQQMERRM